MKAVADKVSEDLTWLEAAGVLVHEVGVDEKANRVGLRAIAVEEAAAAALMHERYGIVSSSDGTAPMKR